MTDKKDTYQGVYFETSDDGLAAFLMVRGVELFGLGIGERHEPNPIVTVAFDDLVSKIMPLVSAYRTGQGDEVSASRYLSTLLHISLQRQDEALRLHRQAESDLAKVRSPPEEPDE